MSPIPLAHYSQNSEHFLLSPMHSPASAGCASASASFSQSQSQFDPLLDDDYHGSDNHAQLHQQQGTLGVAEAEAEAEAEEAQEEAEAGGEADERAAARDRGVMLSSSIGGSRGDAPHGGGSSSSSIVGACASPPRMRSSHVYGIEWRYSKQAQDLLKVAMSGLVSGEGESRRPRERK